MITWLWAAGRQARLSPRDCRRIRRRPFVCSSGGTPIRGTTTCLLIRRWLGLLEGPIDLAYRTTLQPRGNAHIVHSRAKVLGGCSSHNTMIWFRPFPGDWADWVKPGRDRVGLRHDRPVLRADSRTASASSQPKDQNAILHDWIKACASGAGRHRRTPIGMPGPFHDGAGFLDVGYNPDDRRSLILIGDVPAPDPRAAVPTCTLRTRSRAMRIECQATGGPSPFTCERDGLRSRPGRGRQRRSSSACGSIDTPRLFLLLGHRPAPRSRGARDRRHARPARRRREPDRPSGVDHHLEAEPCRWGRRESWTPTARCSSTASNATIAPT